MRGDADDRAEQDEGREGEEGDRDGDDAAGKGDAGEKRVSRGRGEGGRRGPQRAGADRVERRALDGEVRRQARNRPMAAPEEEGKIERRHHAERRGDQRRERAAKGEIEQDRTAADQMDGEEESGGEIERTVALARGILLLLVLEPAEIARQQQPDRRAPLGPGQSGIAIPAAATHGGALAHPP